LVDREIGSAGEVFREEGKVKRRGWLGDGAPRAKLGREADGAGRARGVHASAQDGRER
jgi:hypothetical protein